jgi:transcriptional regulator GlxA family with amidase domain
MGSDVNGRDVAVLLFEDVEVLDFAGPFEVFSVASDFAGEAPFNVFTVAESLETVRTIGGLGVAPNHSFVTSPQPDLLVVPGGSGTLQEMNNPTLVEWVRRMHDGTEITMSVCSGARILAMARLLDGLTVTTHHQVVEHLAELALRARVDPDRRFIDSGHVITTAGISAGIDGSLHVVARLLGREVARATADYMEYDWTTEGSRTPSRP